MKKIKILLLVATALLLATGCRKSRMTLAKEALQEKPQEEEVAVEPAPEDYVEAHQTVDGKVHSYLTGKLVDESIGNHRPIAVMLNNIEAGCPQTGISYADVVYECPVEGRITRLMGIFENWETLEKIGSIRSCRDYYISFALEFDAMYVHFGQATIYTKEMLNSDLVDNISGAVSGVDNPATNAFFRSTDRKAPHNLYASADGILQDIKKFGYNRRYDEEFYGKFKFAADGDILTYDEYPDAVKLYPGGTQRDKANGFSRVGSSFEYNADDQLYYRFQYGDKHIDEMTGEQLTYTNVIFQFCDGISRDSHDYLAFECFGGNDCMVFTQGKMIQGTWWRDGDNSAPAKYLDANGDRIILNQGKTWVCIVWTDYKDDVVVE